MFLLARKIKQWPCMNDSKVPAGRVHCTCKVIKRQLYLQPHPNSQVLKFAKQHPQVLLETGAVDRWGSNWALGGGKEQHFIDTLWTVKLGVGSMKYQDILDIKAVQLVRKLKLERGWLKHDDAPMNTSQSSPITLRKTSWRLWSGHHSPLTSAWLEIYGYLNVMSMHDGLKVSQILKWHVGKSRRKFLSLLSG